jgi:trehalose 6-phosphate phosphatase
MLGGAGQRLLVIGNHGLEWLEPGADLTQMDESLQPSRSAIAAILARVPELPGVEIEDKGLSATIHYRQARDPEVVRARLLTALRDRSSHDVEVREGRRSVELRPVGRGNKGTAVTALVERFRLRGLVVAGDDVTDLDMFTAAREVGSVGVMSAVLGVSGGREVPPEVSRSVDVLLPDPAAFVRLLGLLAGIIR